MAVKKYLLIPGIIILLIFIAFIGFGAYEYLKHATVGQSNLHTPEDLDIHLQTDTINNERKLVLRLVTTTEAAGCDSVSSLRVEESFKDNGSEVDVLGYELTEGSEDTVCPAIAAKPSKTTITPPSDWLQKEEEKTLVFDMGWEEEEVILSRGQYQIHLSAKEKSDAITASDESITLYPLDVAQLTTSGRIDGDVNRSAELRDFANKKGFTPVDEMYPELSATSGNKLFVVVESDKIPSQGHSDSLGVLSDYPDIQVNLSPPQ